MFTFLAQKPTGLGTIGEGGGFGPFGAILWTKELAGKKLGGALSAIVGFMTVAAGIWFIFQFITGAIQWLASGGDKAGLTAAQQKISNSFIGLILVVAAVAIIKLTGIFLGFDILNPASFIDFIKLPGGGE